MTTPGFTVSAFILLLHVSFVANYPSGKVTKSCGGMIPEHGHTPQSHPAHNISVSQKTFRPGDRIKGIVLLLTVCVFHFAFFYYTLNLYYCWIDIVSFNLFICFIRYHNLTLLIFVFNYYWGLYYVSSIFTIHSDRVFFFFDHTMKLAGS